MLMLRHCDNSLNKDNLVLVPEMPLNLAVFDADSAATLIADNPDIDTWVVGGHSLGGAMAAGFAADNSTPIDGLALWAAYPAAGTDLTASPLRNCHHLRFQRRPGNA